MAKADRTTPDTEAPRERPLWIDAGTDPHAIADWLEAEAQAGAPGPGGPATGTAASATLTTRPLPSATDRTLLHQAAILRIRRQLTERHGEADRIIAQEVAAIDDLVRSANLLVERLREWYGLHAPEAVRLAPDAEKLTRLVAEHGERGAVLAALDHAEVAAASVGSDLPEADMVVLRSFAEALRNVQAAWRGIEERVRQGMEALAPNLVAVTGPVVGARLMSLAGGLSRLATMPASTVQLLGAETALFRHLKEGTKPPKHGVLFQHPLVHLAPPWQRGAIARMLALRAVQAARADALTKNDARATLQAEIDQDLARIRQRTKPRPAGKGKRTGTGGGRGAKDRRDGGTATGDRGTGGRNGRAGDRGSGGATGGRGTGGGRRGGTRTAGGPGKKKPPEGPGRGRDAGRGKRRSRDRPSDGAVPPPGGSR